jgi:DNA-binding MarR family transcriptional regulator
MSATSRMIDEIVKKKFIERKEDPKNRRVKILSLTAHGDMFMNSLSVERVKIIKQSANLLADKIKLKVFKKNVEKKK